MKTDEQIAEDFLGKDYTIEAETAVMYGIKTGRELEYEKSMRFSEFTAINLWIYLGMSKWKQAKFANSKHYEVKDWNRATTSALYSSKAFADYFKSLKK